MSYPPAEPRKLTRSTSDKWLAGVCGGIAQYTGWDANLIRIVTVLLVVVGFGSAAIAYLVGWILMPVDAPPHGSPSQDAPIGDAPIQDAPVTDEPPTTPPAQ